MDGIWKPQLYNPSLRDEKAVLSQIILSDDECNHPIWKPATDGAYNTKSGWDTLRNKTPKPPWPPTIWYQGHIPRFAFTAWKAMHNKMLTKDIIRSYGIMIDPICSLCKSEPESVDHLFFRCSYSAWIWKNLLGRAGYRRRLRLSLLEEEEWGRLHSKGKGQVATTLKHCFYSLIHHLWTERNQRIFLSSSTHKKYILRSILMETSTKINGMNIYDIPTQKNQKVAMHFNLKLSPKTAEPRICYWIPPNNLEFKLNADASLEPEGGGIGGLIRGSHGLSLAMFSENVAKQEIFELEFDAVAKGLELSIAMGIQSLWIESDSIFIVDIIKGTATVPWTKRTLLRKIRNQLLLLHSWRISHSWREANSPADFLSKRNCPCKGIFTDPSLAPPSLLKIIDEDRIGTPYTRL
ncbi:uncharacterized protein LOC143882927 [Tasmannia lanceolata]|uniref:uncharacterized protein LOC143882927 n=1 Tax=Tasmannia lanceolata TaxID=3420 RepID=UPI004064C86C